MMCGLERGPSLEGFSRALGVPLGAWGVPLGPRAGRVPRAARGACRSGVGPLGRGACRSGVPLYRVDSSDLGILRLTRAPRVIGLSVERAAWGGPLGPLGPL